MLGTNIADFVGLIGYKWYLPDLSWGLVAVYRFPSTMLSIYYNNFRLTHFLVIFCWPWLSDRRSVIHPSHCWMKTQSCAIRSLLLKNQKIKKLIYQVYIYIFNYPWNNNWIMLGPLVVPRISFWRWFDSDVYEPITATNGQVHQPGQLGIV